jgi:hypothetical protein
MKSIKRLFSGSLLLITSIFLSGCGPSMTTKIKDFPKMYVEKPESILILPPMNETTAAEAKSYYSTTIETPFAYQGYYIFPNELTSEILKQEGIYDSELLYNTPLNKFKDYFGADAVLFTTIKKWDVSYAVIASSLTVSIDAEIKSTKTSETLWKYNGTIVQNLSDQNSSGGIAGLLISAIATAINTALADYTKYAQIANGKIINSAPYGVYHPNYMKDKNTEIIDQTPEG